MASGRKPTLHNPVWYIEHNDLFTPIRDWPKEMRDIYKSPSASYSDRYKNFMFFVHNGMDPELAKTLIFDRPGADSNQVRQGNVLLAEAKKGPDGTVFGKTKSGQQAFGMRLPTPLLSELGPKFASASPAPREIREALPAQIAPKRTHREPVRPGGVRKLGKFKSS